MKMKKILVVTCSKDDGKSSQLLSSLNSIKDDVSLIVTPNNTKGLSEIYNRQLTSDNLIKHDIVLFVHDDVYIDDMKLKGKLYTAIEDLQYDIVGLAGASSIKIKEPCLWHLMSDRTMWSGSVSHPVDDKRIAVTCFGPWPERCLILDGLFLAVNLRRALETGWKFNEEFTFHHYDLSSCLDANSKKLKLGTYPINVTHNSPGLNDMNDRVFVESQDKFLKLYGKRDK